MRIRNAQKINECLDEMEHQYLFRDADVTGRMVDADDNRLWNTPVA